MTLTLASYEEKGEMNAGAEKSENGVSPERSKKGKTQQRFTPEVESERRVYVQSVGNKASSATGEKNTSGGGDNREYLCEAELLCKGSRRGYSGSRLKRAGKNRSIFLELHYFQSIKQQRQRRRQWRRQRHWRRRQ